METQGQEMERTSGHLNGQLNIFLVRNLLCQSQTLYIIDLNITYFSSFPQFELWNKY